MDSVFIFSLRFSFKILTLTAHASYIMQDQFTLITYIFEVIKVKKENLEGLKEDDVDILFTSHLNDNDEVVVSEEGKNCSVTKAYLEKHPLTEKQQRRFEKCKTRE